jgi:hypothetical protein
LKDGSVKAEMIPQKNPELAIIGSYTEVFLLWRTPMRVSFRREPKSEHSYFAEKNFDGYVASAKITENHKCLKIGFATNPGGQGSLFSAYIMSTDFGDLAKEMLRADPESAIRAFGAALQEYGVEKSVDADAA